MDVAIESALAVASFGAAVFLFGLAYKARLKVKEDRVKAQRLLDFSAKQVKSPDEEPKPREMAGSAR